MVAPPPMHETVEDDWRHITASAISPTAKAPSPSVGGGGKGRPIQRGVAGERKIKKNWKRALGSGEPFPPPRKKGLWPGCGGYLHWPGMGPGLFLPFVGM